MKTARNLAEQLVAVDSSYYDAYLAVGVENYMLSLKPMPVRWLLRLGGARTDKMEGVQKLRLTAEKGHYLLPYARLLLAVAALRDRNPAEARQILEELAREFPRNRLYKNELAQAAISISVTRHLQLPSSARGASWPFKQIADVAPYRSNRRVRRRRRTGRTRGCHRRGAKGISASSWPIRHSLPSIRHAARVSCPRR